MAARTTPPTGGPSRRASGLLFALFAAVATAVLPSPAAAHSALVGRGALITVGDDVWVAVRTHGTVLRVDAGSGRVVGSPLPAGRSPIALARAGRTVWVADYDGGEVLRLDARTGRTVGRPIAAGSPIALAVDGRRVWVADYAGDAVIALDRRTGRVLGRTAVDQGPVAVAVAPGGVWVASSFGASVTRIDPQTRRVIGKVSAPHPQDMVVSGGSVWVANRPGGLVRIDARTGELVGDPVTLPGDLGADALAAGAGFLWASNEGQNVVTQHDPRTGRVLQVLPTPLPASMTTRGKTLFIAEVAYAGISTLRAGVDSRGSTPLTAGPLAGPPGAPAEAGSVSQVAPPPPAAIPASRSDRSWMVVVIVAVGAAVVLAVLVLWPRWSRRR